ncbi:MAG: purine-nucleoside phosphorylase, partial [Oscillospiraceae bacterium]|nr:purine-nucleoside phosphorylase [Oscillospiraceae bacterium]
VELAEGRGISVKVGSVFTADMFYNQNDKAAGQYRDMGLLAVEMETAGIYWEAMASHKRALSLLTISDHIFTGEGLSAQDRQDSFTEMMEVALDTAWEAAE